MIVRKFKSILVPVEHGALMIFFEAIIAGLIFAPSYLGLLLAFGIIIVFFMGQAIRVFWGGIKKIPADWRVDLAGRLAIGLGISAGAIFILVYQKTHHAPYPLVFVIALGILFAAYKCLAVWGFKSFLAELLLGTALGFPSAAIMIGSGKTISLAFLVWAVMSLKTASSIIYVRYRLRKSYGKEPSKKIVLFSHALSVIIIACLCQLKVLSWAALIGFLFLLARAWQGIYDQRHPQAKEVGLAEFGWGLLNIVFLSLAL